MTKEKVLQEIQDMITYDFDKDDVILAYNSTLTDMYITSLELADLILKIEETFDIETPYGNGDFPFSTLGEFIDYLVELINFTHPNK